jgi:hypothetical protein
MPSMANTIQMGQPADNDVASIQNESGARARRKCINLIEHWAFIIGTNNEQRHSERPHTSGLRKLLHYRSKLADQLVGGNWLPVRQHVSLSDLPRFPYQDTGIRTHTRVHHACKQIAQRPISFHRQDEKNTYMLVDLRDFVESSLINERRIDFLFRCHNNPIRSCAQHHNQNYRRIAG